MNILIATDGSEFSDAAVKVICQMALKAENTHVKVVSAFESPMMVAAAPYALQVEYNPGLETDLREQAAKAVSAAERQIRASFPELEDNLTTEVLRGAPEQAIVEAAQNWNADLIVVGSHGYGWLERMFLGSVSNAIVRHAPCSVLVVRKADSGSNFN